MLLCLWVSVLFSHTEIYHIYSVCRLMSWTTNEEIIGFDIAIDEIFFMYSLYPGYLSRQITAILVNVRASPSSTAKSPYHLFCDHGNGLVAELSATYIKQIFQTWPKHANYENIIQSLLAEIISGRKSGYFKS